MNIQDLQIGRKYLVDYLQCVTTPSIVASSVIDNKCTHYVYEMKVLDKGNDIPGMRTVKIQDCINNKIEWLHEDEFTEEILFVNKYYIIQVIPDVVKLKEEI